MKALPEGPAAAGGSPALGVQQMKRNVLALRCGVNLYWNGDKAKGENASGNGAGHLFRLTNTPPIRNKACRLKGRGPAMKNWFFSHPVTYCSVALCLQFCLA